MGDKRIIARAIDVLGWAAIFLDPASAPALFEEAIELCRETGDAWWLVDALNGSGYLQYLAGDLALARPLFAEALSRARSAGNHWGMENSLGMSGFVLVRLGELSEAEAAFQESLRIARELKDRTCRAMDLFGLGSVATYRGEYDSAAELFEESLSYGRESSPIVLAFSLLYRGLLDYARGDFETATAHLEEAVILARGMGIPWAISWGLRTMGDVARARGDLDAAGARLEEAVDVGRQVGGWVLGLALQGAGRLARSQGDHDRAESLHHEALELFQEAGHKLDAVEALESLAGLAALAESLPEAARLFGAAEALRESTGYVRFLVDREAYEADVALAREGLTDEEFACAWEEGRAMSLDEAAAYASRGRGERKRPSTGWASLTPSELQVVRLVAEGLSNPQIGERLFVSKRTVQTHLKHVFGKLGLTSRAELASEATAETGLALSSPAATHRSASGLPESGSKKVLIGRSRPIATVLEAMTRDVLYHCSVGGGRLEDSPGYDGCRSHAYDHARRCPRGVRRRQRDDPNAEHQAQRCTVRFANRRPHCYYLANTAWYFGRRGSIFQSQLWRVDPISEFARSPGRDCYIDRPLHSGSDLFHPIRTSVGQGEHGTATHPQCRGQRWYGFVVMAHFTRDEASWHRNGERHMQRGVCADSDTDPVRGNASEGLVTTTQSGDTLPQTCITDKFARVLCYK